MFNNPSPLQYVICGAIHRQQLWKRENLLAMQMRLFGIIKYIVCKNKPNTKQIKNMLAVLLECNGKFLSVKFVLICQSSQLFQIYSPSSITLTLLICMS